jgi:hypothetical protein
MIAKKWILGLVLALSPAAALADGYYSPAPPAAGHYEQRTVDQWVPGSYQQLFVPGGCRQEYWRNVCWPGHYDQRWMPGHYEEVSQQVWVPAPEWNRFEQGRRWHHERHWDHDRDDGRWYREHRT